MTTPTLPTHYTGDTLQGVPVIRQVEVADLNPGQTRRFPPSTWLPEFHIVSPLTKGGREDDCNALHPGGIRYICDGLKPRRLLSVLSYRATGIKQHHWIENPTVAGSGKSRGDYPTSLISLIVFFVQFD